MSPRSPRPAGTPSSRGPAGGPFTGRHVRRAQRHIPARRWPRRLLIAANVAVAVSLVAAGAVYGYINWRFNQIKRINVSSLQATNTPVGHNAHVSVSPSVYTGGAFTVLVVGSDSRAGLTPAEQAQYNSQNNPVAGQRSDTIILMRVDPANKRINIMSIPRDLWLLIKGTGMYSGSYSKINSAFDSGPSDLVQTIEDDLGIPINHFVEVNFNAFMQITNAVGGVRQYFPTPAKDSYSLLNIPAPGCYLLNGDQALQFVRARHYEYYQYGYWHYEAASDLARIQRQQMFIKKIITKAKSAGLGNPFTLNRIVGGITTNLTVDSGFSRNLLLELARRFRSISASTIPTSTFPTYAENNYGPAGGQDVLLPEQQADAQAIAAFLDTGPSTTATANAPTKSSTPTTSAPVKIHVNPSTVSVEVLNGSGVSGQGGQVATQLRNDGFVVPLYGDANNYNYTSTVIRYSPSSLTKAEYLRGLIVGNSVLQSDSQLTSSDVVVVTGQSFGGLRSPSGTNTVTLAPTTTTTTAPVTASSGSSSSSYQLPGTTAADAQAAAACKG